MGKKRKRKQKADQFFSQTLPAVSYNCLSTEELKSLIVSALLEFDSKRTEKAERTLSKVSNPPKKPFKWTWHLLTTKANELQLAEGPISTVKVITALICSLFAGFGYLIAGFIFISALFGIYQLCRQPLLSSLLSVLGLLFMTLMIFLISKTLSVTSVEIEKNTDNSVIFGVSGFLVSLATLILTAFTILIGS